MIIASLPVFSSKWLADMDFSKLSTKFPIATGPYRVKKLDLGKSIMFEKRDDYWGISHPTRTNQFNLTTKRYNEEQIKKISKDKNFFISTISVKDDYGEYGITGLAIVKLKPQYKSAEIDTFLMSCRILGRGIENTILKFIIQKYKPLLITGK